MQIGAGLAQLHERLAASQSNCAGGTGLSGRHRFQIGRPPFEAALAHQHWIKPLGGRDSRTRSRRPP